MSDDSFAGLSDDQNRFVMDRLREFIPPAQYAGAKSVLLRFHNQLHADGDINRFDIHEGEKKSGKKKRGGISYRVKARSAVSLDSETICVSFHIPRTGPTHASLTGRLRLPHHADRRKPAPARLLRSH